MSRRGALVLFWTWLLVATAAVTYPGVSFANRIRPFLFGLPYVFVWVAFWVASAFVVFAVADRRLERDRDGEAS